MRKHPYDTIRPVEPSDLPEINTWYRKMEQPTMMADLMPPQGFFIPGVAAGFLIRTSTNVAILEGLIANPEADKEYRRLGIDKVVDSLLTATKVSGIRLVLVMTEHPRVKQMCEDKGFTLQKGLEVWVRG